MFSVELLLTFGFMALLFLRQISILKLPNKINYAPLMVAIGGLSSVIHFIIHPDTQDILLLIRESLFPLLVSLLLYLVMNILHQTQQTQTAKAQNEFSRVLIEQVGEVKAYMAELEERMKTAKEDDRLAQAEIRSKFKEDIKALDTIQSNQARFLDKFGEMDSWHNDVKYSFENFTKEQLPKLNSIINNQLDGLRISEEHHFKELNIALNKDSQSREAISQSMDALKNDLEGMKNISNDIARAITKHTLQQLSGVTKSFENEISSLKSHAEGIKTSLYESENILSTIRERSEMIMKQMVLSSKKMNTLEDQNKGLHNVYSTIKELVDEVEMIKADYVKSQSQLSVIVNELKTAENEQIKNMSKEIEVLSDVLSKKIDESLKQLHEHYHIADEDITQSVQILAKKAQLRGYTELD
jgi:archaellum component FlaC